MRVQNQMYLVNLWRAAISSSLLFFALPAWSHQEIVCSRTKEDLKLHITIVEVKNIPTLVRWGLYYSGNLLEETQGEGPWQSEETQSENIVPKKQSRSMTAPFSAYDNNSAISFHDNMAVYLYSDSTAIVFDCL